MALSRTVISNEEDHTREDQPRVVVDDAGDADEDDEKEDSANSDEERHKKKGKKKRESEENDYVLDEDDHELLEPGSEMFKRLKTAGRDDDPGGPSVLSDDEVSGNAEGPYLEDNPVEDEQQYEEDWDVGDDMIDFNVGEEMVFDRDEVDMIDFIVAEEMALVDYMTDFIVDEEVDETGTFVRGSKVDKMKSRQAAGVTLSAMQEAHDNFDDVDCGDLREKRLEDEFEPFILSEKYMTENDYRIRDVDVPERMQISEENTGPGPTDELSIEEECVWVHNQLITNHKSLFTLDEEISTTLSINIKDDIRRFLELTHVKKYDIPFIAMYRKESCPTLLIDLDQEETATGDTCKLKWHKVLWSVKDLDRKWLLLQKRKSDLLSYYNQRFDEESCQDFDEMKLSLNQHLFESIIESLQTAETEREVDDVDSKFHLHFPAGEVDADEGKSRRQNRKSQYTICSEAGLWEVASKIGYNSEKLGMLINSEKMQKETPEDIASNFTCAVFESPQAVLRGARHMAALEISCEPRIRKHVRHMFMSEGVVSTSPTPESNVVIDRFHQFARVKWLRDKPLKEFKDAQWLLIKKAEEEKLLLVTVKLPQDKLRCLLNEFSGYYLSDDVSAAAKMWNEQHKLILKDALFSFLLPSMEKEVRFVLTARSKNWLLMEYGKHLWSKVSVEPYQKKANDVSFGDEAAVKVMACCWDRGNPAATFVMLDSFGEVVDVLGDHYISSPSQNVNAQKRRIIHNQRLIKFIRKHQPQVIVLGAVSLACLGLKDDIYEIIWKLVEESPREISEEVADLVVLFGDESLPRLYEKSCISSDQLPGNLGIVKRATALGRYLQNPLGMVASLCGPRREVLSWKLHPLEEFLTPDEKYEMVEQVMVDATNQVGLDINLAASHEWIFSPLQFVAGLGPRKAASLQRALVRNGAITSREKLGEFLKKKVFVNAVGFIRIRHNGLVSSSSHIIDLLDDTRIHPESYELAKRMAKDVSEDKSNKYEIEHVRERPHYLKRMIINEYAKSYNAIDKKETLHDIKMELLQGFRDWRIPYKPPPQDEVLYMLTGETEHTLAAGRIVQVIVRKVLAQKAICGLESRIPGIIKAEDYSDKIRPSDLTLELNEGDVLTCMIKLVCITRYQVYLTCRESDLKRGQYQDLEDVDPYYRPDNASLQRAHEKAQKDTVPAKKKNFRPRMIVHPRFQNITADEAVEFLSDKEVGDSIIHPSYRGPSCLTLTLKVYEGVYSQTDIAESGKDHKDITSLLQLGKTLKIGDDTFEDLEEVMDRYVEPLVTHLKTMLNNCKFRRGTKAEVDDHLRNEKSENPTGLAYCFGISHEHPGTFGLFYKRNINLHQELISLHPKGFKLRKRTFEEIDTLVAYFQRHIDDLPHFSNQITRRLGPGSETEDSGFGTSAWTAGAKDDNGGEQSSFPDAKVQNSPGRQAFPGSGAGSSP